MREFSRGWRRKADVVAMVMACMLTGVWMRSRFVADRMDLAFGGRQHAVISAGGRLYWCGAIATSDWFDMKLGYSPATEAVAALERPMLVDLEHDPKLRRIVVPLLAPTIPLTLLSAYLILWKPRKQPVHRRG